MFFGTGDEDDDNDFTPTSSGSKLSALFGGKPSNKSSSLKYVAPKQPRSDSTGSSGEKHLAATAPGQQPQAPAVLMATAVHAYLYVNGEAQSHGRAMCCLLGNVAERSFQLLLYRSKQDHLTRAKIHQQFTFSVLPNNYANFNDDHQRSWSIMLDTGQYADFVTQVGICRAMTVPSGSTGQFVTQDVIVGDGPVLKESDHAQVSYTTWTVNDGKKGEQIAEPKSGHRIKFKDISGSWETGLYGAQKSSRRLVFLPNGKGNTSIVFYDVTIERVKQKGSGDQSGRNTPQVDLQQQHREMSSSNKSLNMLPEDTESNKDDDGGPISKATIMSRMARMGRPLLPVGALNARHPPTDSESEVEEISRRRKQKYSGGSISGSVEELEATPAVRSRSASTRSDVMKPEPAPRPSHLSAQPQQLVVYQSPWQQPSILPPGYTAVQPSIHPGAQNVVSTPQPPPATPDPTLSLLFSETRSQNTDLKISVSKMSDKIEGLSSKIEKLEQQLQQGGAAPQSALIPTRMAAPQYDLMHSTNTVDAQAILVQITTLVSDNEDMKARLEEKEKKITALNDSVTQLLQKNQKLLEEKTDMLIAKQESGMTVGISEVLAMREEQASITAQLGIAQGQLTTAKEEVLQSKKVIEKQEEEVNNLKIQVQEEQAKRLDLEGISQAQKSKEAELGQVLKDAEAEVERLKGVAEAEVSQKQKLQKDITDLTREKKAVEEKLQASEVEQKSIKEKLQTTLQQMEERTRGDGESSGEKEMENQLREEIQAKATKISQLEQDVADLQSSSSESQQKQTQQIKEYQAQIEKIDAEKEALQKSFLQMKKNSSSSEEVVGTVKKVMNNVFRTLKPQFSDKESYSGAVIMKTLLAVIRDTTLQLLDDVDKKKNMAEVNSPKSETSSNSQEDRGNTVHIVQKALSSECTENISGTVDRICNVSSPITNDCDDNVKMSNIHNEDKVRVVNKENSVESVEPGEENNKGNRTEDNCDKESEIEEIENKTEIEDLENKTEMSSSEGEYTDASDRQFSSKSSVSSSDSISYDCEKSMNIVSLGSCNEVAPGDIQESPDESKAEAPHNDIAKDQREPVIDMDNTEARVLANEKSDSSRDSSLDRAWRPQPPPPPLFSDEEDDDDDWLS